MTTPLLWCLCGCLAVAGGIGSGPTSVSPQAGKVPRVDEADRDPGLREIRVGIVAAAASGDAARLRPFLAPQVKIVDEIADDVRLTPDEVVEWIRAQDPVDRQLFWQALRDALTLGFIRHDDLMCAPYVAFVVPMDAVEGMPYVAIVGRGVRVRSEPAQSSPIIARLDLDFVTMAPGPLSPRPAEPGLWGGNYEWFPVSLADRRVGWVLSKYVGEHGMRRFCFSSIGGTWMLMGWAVGD
jgi:hypothetical protein